MTASLEKHTLQFWDLILKMRRSEFPVCVEYARSIELPTFALATPFPKLADRVNVALGTVTEKEMTND